MHWEDHTFALPKLPKGLKWSVCLVTCDEHAGQIIYKTVGKGEDSVTVPDRCVAILTSTDDEADQNIKILETEKRTDNNVRR